MATWPSAVASHDAGDDLAVTVAADHHLDLCSVALLNLDEADLPVVPEGKDELLAGGHGLCHPLELGALEPPGFDQEPQNEAAKEVDGEPLEETAA
jgi:hypothetical protein